MSRAGRPGRRLGFLPRPGAEAVDYVRRLARLRWTRRFPDRRAVFLDPGAAAAAAFATGEDWIVVLDEIALPIPGGEIVPEPGRVRLASSRSPGSPPHVHTLAELERAPAAPEEGAPADPDRSPAIAFPVADFPPGRGETVEEYVRRLLSGARRERSSPGFAAVSFDVSSGERPEVARHFPPGIRRLLDVGCGAGDVSVALSRANPALEVTGIERRSADADRARPRLDRLIEGDATAALRQLADEGARFDAFLFADILEHLDDAVGALTIARGLAESGATLVASVPNVGHLSIVRDLVLGRFDPVPAGLADAGHLRWFTRASLEDALEEAGWKTERVEGLPGAAAPDAQGFLERASAFPEVDAASLATYQWVAVARAE